MLEYIGMSLARERSLINIHSLTWCSKTSKENALGGGTGSAGDFNEPQQNNQQLIPSEASRIRKRFSSWALRSEINYLRAPLLCLLNYDYY